MSRPLWLTFIKDRGHEGNAQCPFSPGESGGTQCGRLGRTLRTISNVAERSGLPDTGGMKRTIQINVKMTQEDFDLLKKAAEKRWPDAVITNSGIVLALARIAARQALGKNKKKR